MSKAQIKMFETISVLVVFFFILIFGLVYYNNTQKKEIQQIIDENSQLRAMETMKIVNNLPELQCSLENIQTTNCFELLKLQNLREVISKNMLYYTNLFSYSNITVRQIYPKLADPASGRWEIYTNAPKTASSRKGLSLQKQFIPILIYDSVKRRYYAGLLTVEVYS